MVPPTIEALEEQLQERGVAGRALMSKLKHARSEISSLGRVKVDRTIVVKDLKSGFIALQTALLELYPHLDT